LPLDPLQLDNPLSLEMISNALRPVNARSARALQLATEGYAPRNIIAHGVLDYNPGVAGILQDAADFLQEWFEAGAVDSVILSIDALSRWT
jgi:hypothetical protein